MKEHSKTNKLPELNKDYEEALSDGPLKSPKEGLKAIIRAAENGFFTIETNEPSKNKRSTRSKKS